MINPILKQFLEIVLMSVDIFRPENQVEQKNYEEIFEKIYPLIKDNRQKILSSKELEFYLRCLLFALRKTNPEMRMKRTTKRV